LNTYTLPLDPITKFSFASTKSDNKKVLLLFNKERSAALQLITMSPIVSSNNANAPPI
jgi:hypothetical protein